MARNARAAICRTHNQAITVEEISVDPPKRGEVTVRLAACGVCHSDLAAITGTIALPLPLVLGHEGAGVVEDVGEGVSDFAKGDHVVFSFIYMCGKCRFCVSGRPVLCLEQGKALTTPLEGSPRVHDASGAPLSIFSGCGAMAEYATVSAENLIKALKKLTGGGPDYAFECVGSGELAATAYRAIRRGGLAVVVGVAKAADSTVIRTMTLPFEEKTITGSYFGSCVPRVDFPRMLALYLKGELKLEELITRRYRIEEAAQAFADLEAGRNARGVIVF